MQWAISHAGERTGFRSGSVGPECAKASPRTVQTKTGMIPGRQLWHTTCLAVMPSRLL